jgi:ATP-binding cassette subfamily B protein
MVEKTRSVASGARQIGRLLPSVDRRLTVVVTMLGVIVATLPVALSVSGAVLASHVVHRSHAWNDQLLTLVVVVPVLLAALEAARQALGFVSTALGRRVDGVLRERALSAALAPAGVIHLEEPELQKVFGAARNLSPFFFTPGDAAQQLAFSVGARLQSVIAILVIAIWAPLLAVVVLTLWMVGQVVVVATVLGTVASSAIGALDPDVLYLRDLVLTPPAAKEMRVFGLGRWAAWAARSGQGARYVAAAICFGTAIGVGITWIGLNAVKGNVDLTGALVVAVCLRSGLAPPNVIADVPVAYGIFAIPSITGAEAVVASGTAALSGTLPLHTAPTRAIEFRDLRFSYPSGAKEALRGVDLVIPAGQRLAIVGLSGSGKTTLIKLLCRLYDPDAGSIIIDGVDLRDAEPGSWRENIAALFQDYVRWDLSIADNVSLGADREPIERAIRAAGASKIVGQLEHGLDSQLSASADGGVDLSGGQWQRIALARALHAVHRGARLLILDEPTASLDPNAELEFYHEVLNAPELSGGAHPVTTLLISHRFPTVRHADRIVVFEDGRITEDGTHDQLLRLGGRYSSMFKTQAAAFDRTR